MVQVLLWFDTEDYLTPESDEAALALARMLTESGAFATFKVVGEKARVLERRGRRDIIAALKKHDIGYHTDFHSVHPTVAEYLEGKSWPEGVAEFKRREGVGLRDVERIFDTSVSCYGQPGGSWAPQVCGALREWGIPLYLDEGSHVGLHDRPFWYAGVLHVYRMRSNRTRVSLRGEPEALKTALAEFAAIATRLRGEGGGVVSIFYHPCEFATARFWDGVNFAKGANPPREQWQPAPLLPKAEAQRRLNLLREYVTALRDRPEVEFITAREFAARTPDPVVGREVKWDELVALAQQAVERVGYYEVGGCFYSAAEAFWLLTQAVAAGPPGVEKVRARVLLGPWERPRGLSPAGKCSPEQLRRGCFWAGQRAAQTGHVPTTLRVGGQTVAPATLLQAAAQFLLAQAQGQTLVEVPLEPAVVETESQVAEDRPELWGWSIFPEGFHAPRLMELAKLQAWTLKPALLS
ncbi:MAG TPA: hypothetical protein EYP85_12440 [Armatimonadetes bacterium]|nr:hypothetical protein [Armatimonadota bacterium]